MFRRSASTPISNSDAVESLLLLGKKPVISMDHQVEKYYEPSSLLQQKLSLKISFFLSLVGVELPGIFVPKRENGLFLILSDGPNRVWN